MWPDKRRDELPVMPQGRYEIMLRHMPRVGSLVLDMMLRTCTLQTTLAYASAPDMVPNFCVRLALQPLPTVLIAPSPFPARTPIGFLSFPAHTCTSTPPPPTEQHLLSTSSTFC